MSVESCLRLELATLGAWAETCVSERREPRASEASAHGAGAVNAATTTKTMLALTIVEVAEESMELL